MWMNQEFLCDVNKFIKDERIEILFLMKISKIYKNQRNFISRDHDIINYINDIQNFDRFKIEYTNEILKSGYDKLRLEEDSKNDQLSDNYSLISRVQPNVLDEIKKNTRHSIFLINLINHERRLKYLGDLHIDPYFYFIFLLWYSEAKFSWIKNELAFIKYHIYNNLNTIKDLSTNLQVEGFSEWAIHYDFKVNFQTHHFSYKSSNTDYYLFSLIDYYEYLLYVGYCEVNINYVALKKAWDSKKRRKAGSAKTKRNLSLTSRSNKYLAALAKEEKMNKLDYIEKLIEDEYNQKFPKT